MMWIWALMFVGIGIPIGIIVISWIIDKFL